MKYVIAILLLMTTIENCFTDYRLAMVLSCVLRKLDDDDEREELAEANVHPEKDEEAIVKEEDPVLMLGEFLKLINTVVTSLFVKLSQLVKLVNKLIY